MNRHRWHNLHLHLIALVEVALLVALGYLFFSWFARVIAQVIA